MTSPRSTAPEGDASKDRPAAEFDYIIVGGGSAGCILAAQLGEDPALRILLLEAGPAAEKNPETLRASGYKEAFINDALMWDRVSVPQAGCANHRLFLGSGRTVGGSGAINAMVYTRGDRRDFDDWQLPDWRWEAVEPHFRAIEEKLAVNRLPATQFTEACIAAAEATDFQRKDDLNDGDLCGFLGYEWMNIDLANDVRRNAYAVYLRPLLGRSGIELVSEAVVEKILFSEKRAVGVSYRQAGVVKTAKAAREVILCAGALESPKLLMLSGVGPQAVLDQQGIPVVHALESVGKNLQDHPNVSVFFVGKQPTDCKWAQLYGFHRADKTSPLPVGQADTCYVFYSARSSFREGALRLLPVMLLPLFLYRLGFFRWLLRGLLKLVFALPPVRWLVERMYGVVVILGKPQSRGTLTITSADSAQPAAIDPGYFKNPADLEALRLGVLRARALVRAPSLVRWGNRELIPGAGTASDDKIRNFIRKNAMTTYHYAGTCKMGLDPTTSVVDSDLRVHGIAGLRVADASVIPIVPVSALNAPSMMIGHRAAALLTGQQLVRKTEASRAVPPQASANPID